MPMEIYDGYRKVDKEEFDQIYSGEVDNPVNEYLTMENGVFRFDGSPLCYRKIRGFNAKNQEQMIAFDLLDNNEIPIKFLYGVAGSGKTKAALQYGLTKVGLHQFDGLFIVRHPISVGETLGLYSGNKDEKMKNWINPIIDNLSGGDLTLEGLLRDGKLWFDVPGDMQGRDLKNLFIIIDESQQLSKEQVKMLGSRVSTGSVIVFCGDIDQTFDDRFKGNNNGLAFAISELRNEPEVGVVHLTQSVRGRVAELFSSLRV
jgi:PhoH-like ATPase